MARGARDPQPTVPRLEPLVGTRPTAHVAPPPNRFAAMRIDQAKSWVIGDTNGFAPQHPADIVADLLVLLEAYQQAADQVEARG